MLECTARVAPAPSSPSTAPMTIEPKSKGMTQPLTFFPWPIFPGKLYPETRLTGLGDATDSLNKPYQFTTMPRSPRQVDSASSKAWLTP